VCESSTAAKVVAVIVIAVAVVVLVGGPALAITRARGERAATTAVWLGAIVLGVAPALVGGDDGVGVRWLAGVGVAVVASVVAAAVRRRPVLAVFGLVGAVTPVLLAFIIGIGGLFITDECFDTRVHVRIV
jgi:hypothetical protein